MSAILSLVILTLAWAHAVMTNGAVEVNDWQISAIGIAVAGLIYWLFNRPEGTRNRTFPNLVFYLLALMLGLAALQIVPLPLAVIGFISPQRVVDIQSAVPFTGQPVSYATLSSVPIASREIVVTLFCYVLVYFLVRQLAGRFKDTLWVPALPLVIIGTLEGALGVFQTLSGIDPPVGSFVNRNHFAGLLEMCMPMAIMVGFGMLSKNQDRYSSPLKPALLACLFFGGAAIMMLSIVRSSSRMGFMAAMVSLLVMAVAGIFSATRNSPKLRLIPVAIVVLLFAGAFIFMPTDRLAERFADMAATENAVDSESRLLFWKQTGPLIATYPIVGCGLGAYESCFYKFKGVMPESTIDYAHNDYIQILAEFGFTGFAVIFALLVLFYKRAFHNFSVGKIDSGIALACVGAFTAIILHSAADFNLYIPANGLIVAWVAGLVRDA